MMATAPSTSPRGRRQKGSDQRDECLALVFKNVIPDPLEATHLSVGKTLDPLGEKMAIEDQVLHSPGDQHGNQTEPFEPFLNPGDELMAAVARLERDIPNEPMDRDSVLP
jgi:hypothetical protein